jgi:hypothetical protein
LNGNKILRRNWQPGQSAVEFNDAGLASGIYIITVQSRDVWMTRKLVVE